MKNIKKAWPALVGLALVGSLCSSPTTAGTNNAGIAPINSKPHGHSYSEWGASFWQWALGQPANVNPVTDTSGEFCATGQKGAVWFLAGSFGDGTPINRTCTVPVGHAIFFPVINAFYGAFLNDPPATRTDAFMRSQVDCEILSAIVEIDGVAVKVPQQYFLGAEKPPLFDVQLPDDNVFGLGSDVIPELLLSPSAHSGLYLFLRPLPPGRHSLHWEASQTCPFGDFTQNITYDLHVQPRGESASHNNGQSAPIGHTRHIP